MLGQVDLTEYVDRHNFVFDAVLNEEVSNDEVRWRKRDDIIYLAVAFI